MDQQCFRVIQEMAGFGGCFARRIVLDVYSWQTPLRFAQNFMLVVQVVPAGLKQNAIDIGVTNFVDRNFDNILSPWKRAGTSGVTGCIVAAHRQQKGAGRLGQVIQVVAVDVPGKNSQGTGCHLACSR
jgi:hypothetical protein